MKNITESICEFDSILMKSLRARNNVRIKYPLQTTIFQTFMIAVYKEAKIAENQKIQSSRTKIGSQKGQAILQDNTDMKKLDNNSFDIDNFHTVNIGLLFQSERVQWKLQDITQKWKRTTIF